MRSVHVSFPSALHLEETVAPMTRCQVEQKGLGGVPTKDPDSEAMLPRQASPPLLTGQLNYS